MSNTTTSIVLDVDTGIDDAWAIIFAEHSPKLTVMGITTSYGNANIDTTTENSLLMVELLKSHTPVYRGAERPLIRPWTGPVPSFHGHNGMGDTPLPHPSRGVEPVEAAQFIRDVVRAHPHAITLVTVARLTNVARALLYDPELAHLIPRIVMMGGAAFCPGNVTAVAEANIWGDPEAANLVFQSGIPITMVGLDVTMQARLTRAEINRLDPAQPYTNILKGATDFYISAYEADDPTISGWCPLHDPLAVAVVEDPTLIRTEAYPVRVETNGMLTDGMTVVDARNPRGSSSVDVAIDIDTPRFLDVFRKRVGILSSVSV